MGADGSQQTIAALAERARAGQLTVADMLSESERLGAGRDRDGLVALHLAWIEGHSEHPLNYALMYNFGALLMRLRDLAGAKLAFEQAMRLNPDYVPAMVNLGVVIEQMGDRAGAVAQWRAVSEKFSQISSDNIHYLKTAWSMAGRVLEDLRDHSGAEEAFRRSLDLDRDQPEVLQHYISVIQQQCKWPILKPWGNEKPVTRQDLLSGINPLTLAIYSGDPLFNLANSANFAAQKAGRPEFSGVSRHAALKANVAADRARRLRIGYVSAELRHHAGGFLMAEVFELHDRTQVEIFAYSTIRAEGDPMSLRIQSAIEHWRDISELSDQQAAEQILADEVQILIDMQGHTFGSRPRLMAMRPAPVIANWLGFPGSVGTAYHNYIFADDFIVPPDLEIFYSETIARLPCYQPNDRKRAVAGKIPTRAQAGLPEGVMVYCAFNGQHKISPPTWRRWMSILSAVEGSVLWLLESTPQINAQLRSLAESHGVSPERILFAPRIANADHLARFALADLFLDTFPYGAHTTASDAMWMGVPVLTLAGLSFASRVCGSIIRSAGLPDLICTDPADYVARAIELGRSPEKLRGYRTRLADSRTNSILFDTPRLVRSLEANCHRMWARYARGEQSPPDLTNLELYRQIGIELDDDQWEIFSRTDYLARYRETLAERSRYSFIPPDGRVLTPEPRI